MAKGVLFLVVAQVCSLNKHQGKYKRICACRGMEEFHTSMSLEASKNGNIAKAKEHARKAQACRQEVNNLLLKSDNLIDGELEQAVQIVDPEFWTSNMKSENKN